MAWKLLRWLRLAPESLTPAILERLNLLFPGKERLQAANAIARLGAYSSRRHSGDPTALERICFAVLKLSNGNLNELKEWIDVARQDFRDVLMAAGFARDIEAHRSWFPRGPGLETKPELPETMPRKSRGER